jgi:hypothetical protein
LSVINGDALGGGDTVAELEAAYSSVSNLESNTP